VVSLFCAAPLYPGGPLTGHEAYNEVIRLHTLAEMLLNIDTYADPAAGTLVHINGLSSENMTPVVRSTLQRLSRPRGYVPAGCVAPLAQVTGRDVRLYCPTNTRLDALAVSQTCVRPQRDTGHTPITISWVPHGWGGPTRAPPLWQNHQHDSREQPLCAHCQCH
jgi:hypothetical protein